MLYYWRCLLALLRFVWFALFAASVAVVVFGPSVLSSSSFFMLCTFFSLFTCLCLRGKDEGTLFLSVVVCRWSPICCPFCSVRSPCDVIPVDNENYYC